MNKTAIKNFAVWARQKLISDITYKAGMLGVTEDGIADKLPHSTSDLEFYDIGTKDYAEVSGKEIKQRNALVNTIRKKEKDNGDYKSAFGYVVEEVAYTWFNRLIAIRFMEVNDYLPSGVRVLSSENKAKKEPDLVTTPFDTDLEFTSYEQDRIIQLKDDNKLDELFRMLFIKQCNKLHDILPELFEKTDDYSELLLTVSFTDSDGVLYHLVHDIEEDDFNVEKEGQVQIIGWMYQFYNIEPKAVVFGRKGNAKIKKEEIPAATQLFTPDWIVRYMVQNSLGRIFINDKCTGITDEKERINKEKEIAQQMGWQYYLPEAEQTPEVRAQLNANHISLLSELTSIKLIDPCMGSGHILVYAFEVLMQIYLECGYTERDATSLILENNLFGLDIDDRAYQLAYFAVMMKARSYDRRILTRNIKPNVYSIKESNFLVDSWQKISDDEKFREIFQTVVDTFIDAKEYGSILNVPDADYDYALSVIDDFEQSVPVDFEAQILRGKIDDIRALVNQAKLLSQKYDVVVTNPPYMPVSNSSASLQNFVKKNYPDSKTDMFAVFIERVAQLTKPNRYSAMITMHSWMFLSSYEKLRSKILETDTVNMAHLGARAFEEIGGEVVQTTAWIERKTDLKQFKATYKRLVDENSQTAKEQAFLNKNDNAYNITKTNFSKIPGSPIAYWANEATIRAFENKSVGYYGDPKQGFATGSNDRFLRFWNEVSIQNIGFDCKNRNIAKESKKKWFPCNKGGGFRRWFGNNNYVANWENDGFEMTSFTGSVIRNPQYYFRKGITWSSLTSGKLSMRYSPEGFIFESKGSVCFLKNDDNLLYLLGLLNTEVVAKMLLILSPTLDYHEGPMSKVPVIIDDSAKLNVEKIVIENVDLTKDDWDSFETSWDFKEHPLVRLSKDLWDATAVGATMSYYYGGHPKVGSPLELCYMLWQGECNERFNKLKANEEELNRIFIDIYGLQDELTPEVEDKDVTVRKADLQRDIKSLISYAVGCMFGRYSLDTEGIAYAGGDWNTGKYETFIPDADNCIPINDEEYFEDDIVGLFCAWLKKVYGEDSLEQNLDYIAKALGNKGATSREVIRNYFLNDFIKDHIKTYQKRPIYWLFDSGKQNGFKALCYMHRWNADTTGNMRVEYLHRMQRVYEKEIIRMQEIIDNSHDNKEISNATKRKEKLQKQIKETEDYDAKIAHLALSRIDIDLDDGVKVNYEKVQTADGKKMQILAKI